MKEFKIPKQDPEQLKKVLNKLKEMGMPESEEKTKRLLKQGFVRWVDDNGDLCSDLTNVGTTNREYNKRQLLKNKKSF